MPKLMDSLSRRILSALTAPVNNKLSRARARANPQAAGARLAKGCLKSLKKKL